MVAVNPLLNWTVDEPDVDSTLRWGELIGGIYAKIDVRSGADAFHGRLRNADTDGIQISRMTVGTHRTQRLARDIRESESPKLVLCVQISGEASVSQDGRTAVLRPGDLSVYSTTAPYELEFEGEAEVMGVVVPWGSLSQAPISAHYLSSHVMVLDDPLVRAAFATVVGVEPELHHMAVASRRRLVRNLVDVMSTLCLGQIEKRLPVRAGLGRSDRLSRALEHIEENLADPELSVATVAAHQFVSVRSLQEMASESGFGLAAWIRSRRLEGARADLVEFPDRSVADVAASWGLTAPAHFSQMFREAYGITPREYRTRAQALQRASTPTTPVA